MLVHQKVTPNKKFSSTHLYTWVGRWTARVKCLAQQHNMCRPRQGSNTALSIRRWAQWLWGHMVNGKLPVSGIFDAISTSRNLCDKSRSLVFLCYVRLWVQNHSRTVSNFKAPGRAQTWRLHAKRWKFGWQFCIERGNEKQQRPDSCRACLYINHLSYPRLLTLFIELCDF